MARQKSTSIRRELGRLIPNTRLEALADECGAVERHRKVNIAPLFWTPVLGFGVAKERTLAGLRRVFGKVSGTTLVPSAFYDRLTPALARMMKRVLG